MVIEWFPDGLSLAALPLSIAALVLTFMARASHKRTLAILTTLTLSPEERMILGAVLWAAQRTARYGLTPDRARLQQKLDALPERVYEMTGTERFKPEGEED